jgi:hypothetical protein
MSKTFYLTCVYLNYIQGFKSSTQIVIYSQSKLFAGFPEQEFNREDWNAKDDAIHNMGDDSTPIGSCQEANGDAERALGDEDDAQRASPDDGARADGGPKHPEVVLPNVRGGMSMLRPKSLLLLWGEVVVQVEKNYGADQQVQHLNHFCSYQSFLIFYIFVIFYIAPPSGSSKQCR